MKTKRIPVLTWLQFLCCIFVIYGQCFPFTVPYPKTLEMTKLFVYSFHMPVFVFCSGVLLVLSDADRKYTFPTYLKRRALRLLLPYFVFSIIGIVPKVLLSSVLNDSLRFEFLQIVRAFLVPRESIWGHFWFLPMIFVCGLIGYWLQKAVRRWRWVLLPAIIVCACGIFLPNLTDWFAINDIVHYMLYFVVGMSAASLFTGLDKIPEKTSYLFGGLFSLLGIAVFLLLHYCHAGNALRTIIVTFLMLIGLLLLLLPISRKRPLKSDSVLFRSYSIFILSWPCQLAVEVILERVLHLPYWCIMPPVFLSGVLVPYLIIKLIDRIEKNRKHKILTRLIGG